MPPISDKENNASAANRPSAKRPPTVGRANDSFKKQRLPHSADVLRSILEEMLLRKKLVDEAIRIFSMETPPNKFFSAAQKDLGLLLKIEQQGLCHDDVYDEIVQNKMSLKSAFDDAGVLGNTGMIPKKCWSIIQFLHYATPKEVERQTDLDRQISNLTNNESPCCRLLGQFIASHFHHKIELEPPKSVPSIGIIDICCTSFPSNAGSDNRQKLNKQDIQNHIDALGISELAYLLPSTALLTITALLFKNARGRPMPIVACSGEMSKIFRRASFEVSSKATNPTKLIVPRGILPHTEALLNKKYMNVYTDEHLREMDRIVTIIFKNDVDEVTVKDGIESDWFQKLRGDLSEEQYRLLRQARKEISIKGGNARKDNLIEEQGMTSDGKIKGYVDLARKAKKDMIEKHGIDSVGRSNFFATTLRGNAAFVETDTFDITFQKCGHTREAMLLTKLWELNKKSNLADQKPLRCSCCKKRTRDWTAKSYQGGAYKKGQIKISIIPRGCYSNNKAWTTTWVRAKVTTLLVSKMKINN